MDASLKKLKNKEMRKLKNEKQMDEKILKLKKYPKLNN